MYFFVCQLNILYTGEYKNINIPIINLHLKCKYDILKNFVCDYDFGNKILKILSNYDILNIL